MLTLGHLLTALQPNKLGEPQELAKEFPHICANRSNTCSVLLDVPKRCAGNVSYCPVIFCLHGFGGSNRGYIHQCGQHVHRRNWLGIYPQGEPLAIRPDGSRVPGWNDGQAVNPEHTLLRCPYDDFSCELDPNDGIFFETIVGALQASGVRGRFYVFGQSNGADFAQRLAANAGPKLPIAGIAGQSSQLDATPSRSAAAPYNRNQPPAGGLRVAQLSIHGTADRTIAYDGGPKFGSPVFVMYSEPASNQVWARHNGCTGSLAASNMTLTYVGGIGTATHWVWNGCSADAPVEYYQSHGAGHVGTIALGGRALFAVVLDFFERVEHALKQVEVESGREEEQWHLQGGTGSL